MDMQMRSDGSACIKFIILMQEKWIHIITPPCISPELKTILVKNKSTRIRSHYFP